MVREVEHLIVLQHGEEAGLGRCVVQLDLCASVASTAAVHRIATLPRRCHMIAGIGFTLHLDAIGVAAFEQEQLIVIAGVSVVGTRIGAERGEAKIIVTLAFSCTERVGGAAGKVEPGRVVIVVAHVDVGACHF